MECEQIAGSQQGAGEALSLMCSDLEQVAFSILLYTKETNTNTNFISTPQGSFSVLISLNKLHKIQKNQINVLNNYKK